MNAGEAVASANAKQLSEAESLGWTNLFWAVKGSPNQGKWGGARARLFGTTPAGEADQLVPDFFEEVVRALDFKYPVN